MDAWYEQLEAVKLDLIRIDPVLKSVFDTVDASGFRLHTMIKKPFPALIAAIIGQKISYVAARRLRGEFYTRFGTDFSPMDLIGQDLSFLGPVASHIIFEVSSYLLTHPLETEADIRALVVISGIGPWTIETTLLTCFKNWNLFPRQDKFLLSRLRRLYGSEVDLDAVTNRWSPYKSIVTWYLWRYF